MTKRLITRAPGLIGRRSFLRTSGAAVAATGLGGFTGVRKAFAQDYPSRNIDIVIPTGEGGGADRDARAFTSVWGKHLNTNFQFGYFPGAAGQVGYEFYMDREPDAYSLLFANLGPEIIMLALQDTGIEVGRDIVFIQQTLSEPMAVWVGPNSPIRTLEELVELGRSRPITVATSRLPHPASIGMLALGEAMGMEIVLVPYGGGNPTAMAAITQETDCAALPVTNTIVLDDQAHVLGLFADENVAPEGTDNAPTVNDALGTSIPELTSSRAWGVHRAAYDAHPDRIAALVESMEATLADPDYTAAVEAAGVPTVFIDPGDEARAMASAAATTELARRYRDLLTGS
ncbi:Bug family tripartite tricarboxylate transporter substrate binding protein [Alkalilacustris brevis]|uniref:Bug family tripartite tricarboxylate transporter substrate binding protein n=1 Tax=Alkalilacustris brevis TaxID=2026338 RepID=UPI000E0D4F50|nr:tripartite tricarboxylate transporter substrate-binding protein [Alkalilacustris brevis]